MKKQVVEWNLTNGRTLTVCDSCDARMTAEHRWPAVTGVRQGAHAGYCDVCQAADDDA